MVLILTKPTASTKVLLANDCDGTAFDNRVDRTEARNCHSVRQDLLAMHTFRRIAETPGVANAFVTGRNIRELEEGCKQYGFEGVKLPWVGVDTGIHVYERQGGELKFDKTFHSCLSEQVLHLRWDKQWLMGLFRSESTDVIHPTQDRETQDPDSLKVQFVVRDISRLEDFRDLLDRAIRDKCHGAAVAISSFDPAKGLGFLDVMPIYRFENPGNPRLDPGVTGKVIAIEYMRRRIGLPVEQVAYSGDSGNDAAALVHGYFGTVVENASDKVRQMVLAAAKRAGTEHRLSLPSGAWEQFTDSACLRGVIRGAIQHAKFFSPEIIIESERELFGR